MSYYFFLADQMLPVPPPKMSLRVGNKNKTVSLIDEGEINILKTPGLSEISFDVLLPNNLYPFANYDTSLSTSLASRLLGRSVSFTKSQSFTNAFERHKSSRAPVRFIVTRMSPRYELLWDTNLLVTVEEYSVNEDAKDGPDVVVSLKLKQYRPYATKELEVTTDENGNKTATVKQSRPTDRSIPKAVKIGREQSVWEAVKRATGGSLDWRSVANLSGIAKPVDPIEGAVLNLVR